MRVSRRAVTAAGALLLSAAVTAPAVATGPARRAVAGVAAGAGRRALQAGAPARGVPACTAVPVRLLDAKLDIDAVAVGTTHPPRPAGAAICSYYGATGRSRNEATIVYMRATAAQFRIVVAVARRAHRLVEVAHLAYGAYGYETPVLSFLYVLYGTTLAEIYADVPLARVVALARAAAVRLSG